MRPKFIFFCGSSAVGKTELVTQFPPVIEMTGYLAKSKSWHSKNIETEIIKMNFRDIREQLGNPSWENLSTDSLLAEKQQTFGMKVYEQRLRELAENAKKDTIYLLERCPMDVAGYSTAFGLSHSFIQMQYAMARAFMQKMKDKGEVYLIHRPIDPLVPYAIEAARPPVEVRNACGDFLQMTMDNMQKRGLFNILRSVNKEDALKEILDFCL